MANIKYIEKVILPKDEECVFVDKTWRNSPAFKITKGNILNWNTKFSKSLSDNDIGIKIPPLENGQIPSQYLPSSILGSISPEMFLLIYLTIRNDTEIKLVGTTYNNEIGGYSYTIQQKQQNVLGEIANTPVSKVIINENNLYNTTYEIYFVADQNFQGLYYINLNNQQQKITYTYSNEEEDDFTFIAGHLYKITNGLKVKDCSNVNINFTNGVHQKVFNNINVTTTSPIVGQGKVGFARI